MYNSVGGAWRGDSVNAYVPQHIHKKLCGNAGAYAGNSGACDYACNGNLGAGVAVMGAFSLVRFRSVPGTAREINSIFLAMAVGLACGMGYIGAAVVFVIIMEIVNVVLTLSSFGDRPELERSLRITIPESLDYTDVFEEIFDKYVTKCELVNVKTSSMGSLFKLEYRIRLKDSGTEKDMIDELRCRNGNLEIMCSRAANQAREEL